MCRNYPNAVREVLVVLVERANRFVEIAALKGWLERKVAQLKGECCDKSIGEALKFGSPQRLHVGLLGHVSFHLTAWVAVQGDVTHCEACRLSPTREHQSTRPTYQPSRRTGHSLGDALRPFSFE